MSAQRTKLLFGWSLLIVVALVVGGLLRAGVMRLPGQLNGAEKVSVQVAKTAPPVGLADFKNGFASVIDPALPAVVNISSTKIVKQQFNFPGFFNDPFFQQFFGDQFPPSTFSQTEREYSLGSGVIVNPNGYILTNNHVVSGALDVEVFTQDRQKFKAKIVGTDPRTDIAVLRIDAAGLCTLTLADSSKLKVGDLVFAIGDPFGVGETATMGIVSATGRGLGGAIEHYEDFIQTDAAINPGNSGGALIDIRGNLVGINTAIITGGGGNEGIGFAIPVNMARNVMDQIVEHGKVIRGYLGVTIQAVDPDMAKAFGLSHGGGALIGDVTPNSPAAKAGMERGDVVLKLNGEAVNGPDDLSVRVSEMAPGAVAHLQVFRNGQLKDMDVTLGEYPQAGQAAQAGKPAGAALKGIEVQNLTPDLAQQLGVPLSTTGVAVTEVDPSSPSAEAGIKRGDVIQEVNHKPVHNVEEYVNALAGTANQPVLLLVNRAGVTHFVVVEPQ
jgi:serine protease Do